jgi:hypothetical protein
MTTCAGRDSPTHIFRTIIAESRPDPGCLEVPYRALGSAMAVVQGIVIRLDEYHYPLPAQFRSR